jgi:hypothetical protein
MLPTLQNQTTTITQTTTMTADTPQNHHTEALHPTRNNHWQYHWFNPDQFPSPSHPATWKPSCKDKGCRHWNHCYDCNAFIASLLVNKAKFLAQKQLEEEYPETGTRTYASTTEQTLTLNMTLKERNTITGTNIAESV